MDKEKIRSAILGSGCVAVGFAEAAPVSQDEHQSYLEWLAEGKNAGMDYLNRHASLRLDPDTLLPGVRTVISMAFSFHPEKFRPLDADMIACYAYGRDYHDVIRRRLRPIVKDLKDQSGGEWRICVDTAPIAERYWAVKAGVGVRLANGCVDVPGYGNMVFLAEILTTLEIPADSPLPCNTDCHACGACRKICPAGALGEDGRIDARRCLSYLSIEHRGEWTEADMVEAMNTPAGQKCLYGCDLCLRVCPKNQHHPSTQIGEFAPLPATSNMPELLELTRADILSMTEEDFRAYFSHSAAKRAGFEGLRRNASPRQ